MKHRLYSIFSPRGMPVVIVAVYVTVGMLWIIFSDLALSLFFADATLATWLSISKGMLFVSVSAVILFLLIRAGLKRVGRVEGLLLESEERFRNVVEFSPMAVYLYRLEEDGRLVFKGANPAADRFIGISHNRLIGQTIEEAFPNLAQTEVPGMYRKVAKGDLDSQAFEIQYEDERFSGFYGVHVFRTTPLSIAVLFTEISERKRTEMELRRLKDSLSNMIDSMPAALIALDGQALVTKWNIEAERLLGLSAGEAVGKTLEEALPDFLPWIKEIYGKIRERQPAFFEKLLIHREEEWRYFDLMLYPLLIDDAEGSVIKIEDVTEKAKIQDFMVQTEKMLSVSGLAGGMAHELNNPLGIITQAAQNIGRRISPEIPANREVAERMGIDLQRLQAYFERREVFKFIDDIRSAASRAARIIANMLQFARRSESIVEKASLYEIVERVVEIAAGDYDLKKKYDFQGIKIIREFDADIPDIPMVKVEIEQVILNLLRNAGQALAAASMQERSQIVLRLKREEKYAVLEVEDNGPGMEEKIRRRVFEPFFTTKEPGAGTGLGLSVSYTIVTRNHKGLLSVESSPGKGACFTVKLPLSDDV